MGYGSEDDFLSSLLDTFREEADEHIDALSAGVVELEDSDPSRAQGVVERLFREAHSLKGAARAVEMHRIESLCQEIEGLFARWQRGEVDPDGELFSILSQCADHLRACAADPEGADPAVDARLLRRLGRWGEDRRGGDSQDALPSFGPAAPPSDEPARPQTEPVAEVDEVSEKPVAAAAAAAVATEGPVSVVEIEGPPAPDDDTPRAPAAEPAPPVSRGTAATAKSFDTIRVSSHRLEELMLHAEEFIGVKLTTRERAVALRELAVRLDEWKREWHRVRVQHDPDRLSEFAAWNAGFMGDLADCVGALARSAEHDHRAFEPLVDELVDGMKQILMLPLSSLLSGFPKMVRDLARDQGKSAELVISGGDVEIDKRIIENLRDPLTHILRNAVDHGVEQPDARVEGGKSERATIRIDVRELESNKVTISISDDGAGIDRNLLRAAARKAGTRTDAQVEQMAEEEVLSLVFGSGVSTSPIVTDVSGRGLGLAIVLEKVELLGGNVVVASEPGKGTVFRITVPATLATTRGIVVEVGSDPFVIPVLGVERVTRIHRDEVASVEDREAVRLRERTMLLVRAQDALGIPGGGPAEEPYLPLVILGSGDERIACAVDRIVGEQEVLVKSLGPQLTRVRYISGATILGSGRLVPILNVADLLLSAGLVARSTPSAGPAVEEEQARQRILIAEDSITSRMLLKGVLESAGYDVTATADGAAAFATLREDEFDLVISDVEMPRMDGFELTTRIRADEGLAQKPVMLVTGLESREHRERGIDAGANAYITKQSFSKGTLLDTVRSLL